ncbi:MAG: hypothetical protein C5B49_11660 [Bdellovibrio sp.]|nr:MAG: hypothetical protein C5B49_11660 [Bdellovibrio sp.]
MNIKLVGSYYTKIVKSLKYLNYTYQRVLQLPVDPTQMSDPEKEVWDGFVTRFARSSDLFLSKFVKAYVRADDPAFDGSFRDHLNRAEKLRLIDSVDPWLEIRELRNVLVHEYSDSDLKNIFEKMIRYTPMVLDLEKRLAHASQGF